MAIRVRWQPKAGTGALGAVRQSGDDPVGAALERFGQQLGGAVSDIGGAMERKRLLREEARARAAKEFDDNAFKDAQAALTKKRMELARSDSGYRSRRGGEAIASAADFAGGLKFEADALKQQVPESMRADFDRWAGIEVEEFASEVDSYVAREADVFLSESHTARVNTHAEALAETVGIGSPLIAARAAQQAAMIAKLEHDEEVVRKGGSGEAALARAVDVATKATEQGALAALDQGMNPDDIEATVAALGHSIDSAAILDGKVGARIAQVRDERMMTAVVEKALDAGGDSAALAVINESPIPEGKKQDARGLYISRANDRKRLRDMADDEGLGRIEQDLLTVGTHPSHHKDFAGLTDAHKADALRMYDARLRSLRSEGMAERQQQSATDALILETLKGMSDEDKVTARLATGMFADLSPKAREVARQIQNSTVKSMQRNPAMSGQTLELVINARLDARGVGGKKRRNLIVERTRAAITAAREGASGSVAVFSLEDVNRTVDEMAGTVGFLADDPAPARPGAVLDPGGGGEVDPTKRLPAEARRSVSRRRPTPPGKVVWRNTSTGVEFFAPADKQLLEGYEVVSGE